MCPPRRKCFSVDSGSISYNTYSNIVNLLCWQRVAFVIVIYGFILSILFLHLWQRDFNE